MFLLVNLTKVSTAAHSMFFAKVSVPTRISTDPGHGTRIDCIFYPYLQGFMEDRSLLIVYVFTSP